MSELLPCPFCGDVQDSFGGMYPESFARCGTGFAVHCQCDAMGPMKPDLITAVEAWNTRHGSTPA